MNSAWRQLAVEIVTFLRGGIRPQDKAPIRRSVAEESLVEAWERRIKILDRGTGDYPRFSHYKGAMYEVLTEGLVEATHEQVVVYRSLLDGKVWVRPHAEFHGQAVDGDKLVPRFTRVP